MPPRKRPAGVRYPHAADDADHSFCNVLRALVLRIERGIEPWGAKHVFPPVAKEMDAKRAKSSLYRSRNHSGRGERTCPTMGPLQAVSVRADYDTLSDGTYQVWVMVWDRLAAKSEIARRVKNGEALSYNVMRKV